jgi:O-antigen ligase
MLSVSRPLVYWFSASDAPSSYLEGNPLDRSVRIGLMVLGWLVLQRRRGSVVQVLRNNKLVVLIFAYMVLSILWSDFPVVSLKRVVRALGFLIMVLIVLTEDAPWKAIDAVGRRLVYVAVPVSMLLIKYYPQLGVSFHRWQGYPMWIGITISKNDFGVLACYGALFMLRALWTWKPAGRRLFDRDYLLHLFLFLLCLYMLKGSGAAYSATSILVFCCGLMIHAGLSWFKAAPTRFPKYAAVILGVALLLLAVMPETVFKSTVKTVGREENLTGRRDIWHAMFTEAMKRPIVGTGYGAFYIGDATYDWSAISGGTIGEGHNGYLDVFLELGIIGLTLYAWLIVSALRSAVAGLRSESQEAGLRLTLLAMALIHNMTESGLFSGLPSLWFVWLLAVMARAEPPGECAPLMPLPTGTATARC